MSAIEFVIRTRTGIVERGSVGGDNQGFLIDAGSGNDISLNLRQADLRGYDRAANDLLITLADGRVIVLEGYFDMGAEGGNRLFLSADGILNQVSFVEAEGGTLYAQYGPTETWGKWGPGEDLIFVDEPRVVATGYGADDEVSMLAAPLLGALGTGAAGIGAAGLGGLALLGLGGGGGSGGGSGGGGGGGGGGTWTPPTVDNPDAVIEVGGDDEPSLPITGTANPGSSVTVTVGDETVTGVAGDDGTWGVVFEGETFPEDGEYVDVDVVVTDPDGTVTDLDGPTFVIDTTPPAIVVEDGAVSTGDLFNADGHAGGVAVSGSAEAGSIVTITVGTHSQTVTAAEDGSWSFSFDSTVLPAGEYVQEITVTATDAFGNSTVITDGIAIDTVAEVALTNAPLTGDDLINASEHGAGVTLTGTSQPGSSVMVTIEGIAQAATVAADGSWSVTFDSASLAAGTYTTTATIVATDSAGNTATTTHGFAVDTEGSVTINTATVATDGVVNAAERSAGVVLTGTSEPGSSVLVTVEGSQFEANVAASGAWSVTLPAAIVPQGERMLQVSASATDAAGNVSTASGAIRIDTQTSVTVETSTVEGDGVVNAAEHADGVTLTGLAEPDASVVVTLGTISHTVRAGADGSWSASFTAAEVPTGERVLDVTAVSTDLAGNTATATGTLDVDTFVRNFTSTARPGGADQIVNAAEAEQGVTFAGTTEPGSTVMVSLAGVQLPATVAADGSWTVTFAAGQLPSGEQTVTMTATATDRAGNTDTINQSVRFDTDAGILTLDPDPVEGDDVVNFVEASDGVVLTGTSNPGQMVQVTLAGVTHSVLTGPDGHWQAPFSAAEVAPGTYTAQITATITDSAGNTLTRTDSVKVDTEVLNFGISATPVEGDGIVNAAEASDGVRLTGTTEPGSSVAVTFQGMVHAATVDGAGNWFVDFPAVSIPQGEMVAAVVVDTTDPAGNTARIDSTLSIDTVVNALSLDSGLFTADGVLNAAEVEQGLTLTGQVEAGSRVVVTLSGLAHVATVDAAGNWTVDIPAAAIPRGEINANLLIAATDAAGNTRSMTETVAIDTTAPDSPEWIDYSRGHAGLTSITTDTVPDAVEIGHVVSGLGGFVVEDVAMSATFDIPGAGTLHRFASPVADGSHLVVSYTDDAGNTSGSLLVTDDPATNAVTFTDQLAQALGSFQIETIDLQFAEDTQLTITEAQILALSDTTDTLAVLGGADDSVTISGAVQSGKTSVAGQGFNVFTLGDATILIDDDITNVNTGVL